MPGWLPSGSPATVEASIRILTSISSIPQRRTVTKLHYDVNVARPREHGEDTRDRLLEVAAQLLTDEGPSSLSVRRLADEAGTTTRAIYSLFGSKDGLLLAMYRRGADAFVRLAEAVQPAEDPLDEFVALAASYRAAALENPNLYGLLFGRDVPGFEPADPDREYLRGSLNRVFDVVRRAVESGRIGHRDPWALTNELWSVVHGLASLELLGCFGDSESAELSWQETLSIMVAGLTAQTPPTIAIEH